MSVVKMSGTVAGQAASATVDRSPVEPAVRLAHVTFRYPGAERPSISDVDLEVRPGEFVVLTGGSGSGKTTLTRVINGLAEQFYEGELDGEADVCGRSVSERPLSEVGRVVGSIFQDPRSQFFASITEDEVAFGCENYGVPHEELDGRVTTALHDINGEDLAGRQIYPMSSGEKQKVAIASVNAVDPGIYVFDEPSANLDMRSVEALRVLMGDLKARGRTIVVSEHRLYYLMGLADRFLLVRQGQVLREWTADELRGLPDAERRGLGLRAPDLTALRAGEGLPCERGDAGDSAAEPTGGEAAIPHGGWPRPNAPHSKRSASDVLGPSSRAPAALEVRNLTCAYRHHAILDGVSLTARAGEVTALVGRNGVGKTTLARVLCGVQRETSGEVLMEGEAVRPGLRRRQAYFVMQDTDCQLFGDSLLEELQLNRGEETDERLRELLDAYGLLPWADAHPATLSGGQRQRLTLAVCELMDTPIVILDEPTSGLDYGNMLRISERLRAFARQGRCVLVITHDYEFCAMTCTNVACLGEDGRMEEFPLADSLPRLYECLTGGS